MLTGILPVETSASSCQMNYVTLQCVALTLIRRWSTVPTNMEHSKTKRTVLQSSVRQYHGEIQVPPAFRHGYIYIAHV